MKTASTSLNADFQDPDELNAIPVRDHKQWLMGTDAIAVNGYGHQRPYARVDFAELFRKLPPVVEVFGEVTEEAVLKALTAKYNIYFTASDAVIHFTQTDLLKEGESRPVYILALPYSQTYQGCATLRVYNPGVYAQKETPRDEDGQEKK